MDPKTGLAAVHAAVDQPNMIPKADHDAALAANAASVKAAAEKAGAAAAQARIKAIMTDKAAVGRAALANHLAFNTEMPVDAAIAVLDASPKETAAAPSRLDGRVPSPNVTAAAEPGAQDVAQSWDKVVALVNKDNGALAARR